MDKEEYVFLNRVIILAGGVLFGSFIYFSGISCTHLIYAGEECGSCGVTRDLYSFINFDFENPINTNSLRIFIFIILQFIYRLIVSIWDCRVVVGKSYIHITSDERIKKVIIADAMITSLYCIFAILPFWI